jgi:hypothetical protein
MLVGCSVHDEMPEIYYKESVLSADGLNSPPKLNVFKEYLPFGFGESWEYTYLPHSYNMEIYPYTVNSFDLEDMRALWDLNSNGIVDLYDYSIYIQIDMAQLLEDMKILKKHPMTQEQFEALALDIYNKEKDFEIADYKLFKILLWQSDFKVLVSSYTSDDIVARLSWESNTQTGWLDIHWWSYDYWYGPGFKYTYKYEISNK